MSAQYSRIEVAITFPTLIEILNQLRPLELGGLVSQFDKFLIRKDYRLSELAQLRRELRILVQGWDPGLVCIIFRISELSLAQRILSDLPQILDLVDTQISKNMVSDVELIRIERFPVGILTDNGLFNLTGLN